ncbi:filamentous hemagglutinin N-terminal domain-containing protein [Microcoleus sp. S28C3]|uniref:two-partner secretion domain-containing protein n=1 Tax=Microcoleus sp. S28C3 TaxID=3055414 RepID=UPI002FD0368A
MPRQSSTLFFAFLLLFPLPAIAQIIPDSSLGAESSRTVTDTINNLPSDRITGGATRGVNLFHSLREFNIRQGRGAYFENPSGIANIFTRVTGGNPSNILGTLGVLGNSNLFLINPKGIVFGPNARLELRGSFIGSTGSGVLFDNGFEFSATDANTVPLLAINIPVGLRFRENSGTIINTSQAIGPTPTLPPLPVEIPVSNKLGLAVDPGQTLALVGGDIQFNGGIATASNGQILLGSVKSPGLVSFGSTPQGLNLNYDSIQNFGNIQLSNGTLINTSGIGGGKVDIRGGNVTISGGRIYAITLGNIDGRNIDISAQQLRLREGAQISTLTSGEGAGGDANIRATDSVEIMGIGLERFQGFISEVLPSGTFSPFDQPIAIFAGTSNAGAGGDVRINTGRLLMDNGAIAFSATLGAGTGGSTNIRARTVEIASSAIDSGSFVNTTVTQNSIGNGEDINIEAERLIVRDNGALSTASFSNGASGNINIKASESVEVLRTLPGTLIPTLLATNTLDNNARAGDINIDTKRLVVSDGAWITLASGGVSGNQIFRDGGPGGNLNIRATESVEIAGISGVLANGAQVGSFLGADTYSSSRGGDIRISTPVITLRNGGFISTASLGEGSAGNITIDASRVELIGTMSSGGFNSTIQASVGLAAGGVTNPSATGNAGSVNLNVDRLIVRDGATLNVQALARGRAGNINVVADSIALDNKARIDATTDSGGGGNINIKARDIQLRHSSRITTDAGISDGGNINIKSDILVGLPIENSDITANARTAMGGQVTVNVPNIFGSIAVTREQARSSLWLTDAEFAALQVNPTSLLPTSDIAAISQQSGPALQGAVTFSTTGVNPAQGLVELEQNVVDPSTLIAANPCIEGAENEFTVTGKGGVPPSPNDALSSAAVPFPWVEPALGRSQQVEGERVSLEVRPTEIIPAQGWVMDDRGQVRLVAYNSGGGASLRSPKSTGVCVPR